MFWRGFNFINEAAPIFSPNKKEFGLINALTQTGTSATALDTARLGGPLVMRNVVH